MTGFPFGSKGKPQPLTITPYSRSAYFANDESALVEVIKAALLEMVQGDYTTTSAGVTTSRHSQVAGNLALISSTNYPGWKGHLRAKDITNTEAPNLWDAGKVLNAQRYNQRRIFTGFPSSDRGRPVPLFSRTGAVNLVGGCTGCGTVGVRDVWQQMGTPPSDDEIRSLVQWMAGKGRAWKLGPIFRSVPATVGPPPSSDLPGHDAFATRYAKRDKLTYVTSNDGMLHAFRIADGSEAFAYVPPNLWPKIHTLWKQGGQDTDPKSFKWILAASPRTMDVPLGSGTTINWRTHLMLTMGPGDDAFVVLDITDPARCDAVRCRVRSRPLRIVKHSRDMALQQVMGETWSVPTYFYTLKRGRLKAQMAMGGGYANGLPGNYYLFFPSLYRAPASALHAPYSSGDVALLASPASVVDRDKFMTVVATYQADLSGRVVRYPAGKARSGVSVLSEGTRSPFYHSPAVRLQKDGSVLLAATSGSLEEETPLTNAESKIYMRSERGGDVSVAKDKISCNVSDICSRGPGCPATVPTTCLAPSSRALPVGSPMILKNKASLGMYQHEAFFLYYDPPASVCATGSSWLIRVGTSGSKQSVISSTRYFDTRASGITLVGGGKDLAITKVGIGKEQATLFSVFGLLNAGPGGRTIVETRKEMPKYNTIESVHSVNGY